MSALAAQPPTPAPRPQLLASPSTGSCNVILQYERLKEDFDALMRWRRLPSHLPMPRGSVQPTNRTDGGRILEPTVRAEVEAFYAADFALHSQLHGMGFVYGPGPSADM